MIHHKYGATVAACSLVACIAAAGCSAHKQSEQTVKGASERMIQQPTRLTAEPSRMLPRATVYRMAGNATAANVPVQVGESGNIVSFPSPSDVKGAEPLALANGYLLDRRGINANSRFTRWTYAEYGALASAPGPDELKAAIIPGARAVDIHVLEMTPWEAAADTAAINRLIEANFRTSE